MGSKEKYDLSSTKMEYGKCWNMHYAIGHLIVITSSNLWQDVIPKYTHNQSNGPTSLSIFCRC